MHRVVISGLGVVSPVGVGKDAFWQACVAGRSGIGPITSFDASFLPTRIAGEVSAFDPLEFGMSNEEAARLDRGTSFALAAAQLACAVSRSSDCATLCRNFVSSALNVSLSLLLTPRSSARTRR